MKDKKLVIVLIVLVIILLIGGAYMFGVRPPNNYEVNKGVYPNLDNSQLPKDYSDKLTGNDSWITDSKIGLTYNSKWQVTPELYRTPAQQENGEPLSIIGYRFTLSSGNTISYGGRQNGCTMSEAQNEALIFKYGISQSTCIKGEKVHIGLSDVRKTLPQEDLNLFGDFVLKNQ